MVDGGIMKGVEDIKECMMGKWVDEDIEEMIEKVW